MASWHELHASLLRVQREEERAEAMLRKTLDLLRSQVSELEDALVLLEMEQGSLEMLAEKVLRLP